MLSWRAMLAITAGGVLAAAGCRQHALVPADDERYRDLARSALHSPPACDVPEFLPITKQTIATVRNPEGLARPIGLAEALALALEHGRTGAFFGDSSVSGILGADRGSPSGRTDRLRVFAYDPALASADIEESLAKFDAQWRSSMTWTRVDRPVGTSQEFLQAGQGAVTAIDQDLALLRTELVKPLPTGGLAGISFATDYELSNLSSRVNPAYRPVLQFSFEQPLFQGAGVGINRLRSTHPGGVLTPISVGGRVPGILLARISHDQTQAEFERQVMDLLFAVERAYWQLYFAYWDLYTRETAMLQAYEAWRIEQRRFKEGSKVQDLAQAEAQFHDFQSQRLQALGPGRGTALGVLEAERNLRYVLGLPAEDGYRLIPTDTPTVARVEPNWELALGVAMVRRPELTQARQAVHAAQLAVLREKDSQLPDIRFLARYNVNALGSHLDGKDENSALRNLAEGRFNDWELGLRAEIPIGFREAHAEVQKSKLRLGQTVAFLQDQEEKLALDLQHSYREVIHTHRQIELRRAQRQAAATRLRAQHRAFVEGEAGATDLLLRAQREWADTLAEEQAAIFRYNVALIDFERKKGTIMEYDHVGIAEGELPACAQSRASEHIRERDRAIKPLAALHEAGRVSEVPASRCTETWVEMCYEGQPEPIPVLLRRCR